MKSIPKPETLPILAGWYRPYPGIPPEVLFKDKAALRKFVELKRLPQMVPTTQASAAVAQTSKAASANALKLRLIDLGIRGGITAPHLHLDDKIYLLSQKQWEELSAKVLERGKSVLAKARTISFETAVNLSSALRPVGSLPAPMSSRRV